MAKKPFHSPLGKLGGVPGDERNPPAAAAPEDETPPAAGTVADPMQEAPPAIAAATVGFSPESGRIAIELPLGLVPGHTHIRRHLEVQLTHDQAHSLRQLFEGLVADRARLASERPVASLADAIRWLCEQIEAKGGE
jgi:hypothetical protein